jgi:succinoglycan biosynthesis protein ExoA
VTSEKQRTGKPAVGGTDAASERPTVTIGVPVFNEERHIERCLDAVCAQTYPQIIEVLVADGGSSDGTRALVAACPDERVRLLENPRRIRPAGLNVMLAAATGDIFVRVDARTTLADDYVERCVDALERTNAAMVGGPMRYTASSPAERGIQAAMRSRLGAGPAPFRREDGEGRFVDTVYLGAYRLAKVRELGCYDEFFGGNEDAELAFRAQQAGGVYLDPAIWSSYAVREGLEPLWQQFRRYGKARAVTIRKHPSSLSARQLAVPALVLGMLSPWRKPVVAAYLAIVGGRAALETVRQDATAGAVLAAALPTMHAAWAVGFVEGMLTGPAT